MGVSKTRFAEEAARLATDNAQIQAERANAAETSKKMAEQAANAAIRSTEIAEKTIESLKDAVKQAEDKAKSEAQYGNSAKKGLKRPRVQHGYDRQSLQADHPRGDSSSEEFN